MNEVQHDKCFNKQILYLVNSYSFQCTDWLSPMGNACPVESAKWIAGSDKDVWLFNMT